jgi:hypothetical protein
VCFSERTRDDVMWEQTAKVNDEVMSPEEGGTEVEGV